MFYIFYLISLRAQFGIDEMKNAIHGSSSVTKAKQVIDEFFPDIKFDEEGKVLQGNHKLNQNSSFLSHFKSLFFYFQKFFSISNKFIIL